jgi:hypothetical protein
VQSYRTALKSASAQLLAQMHTHEVLVNNQNLIQQQAIWLRCKQAQGCRPLTFSNRSRTRLAPTPTNSSTNSEAAQEKKGVPASPATALASSVLPVPGGHSSSSSSSRSGGGAGVCKQQGRVGVSNKLTSSGGGGLC